MNPICLLEGNTLVTRLSMAEVDPGYCSSFGIR